MMRKLLLLSLLCITAVSYSQTFEIRGVLPWHNFLSGPTGWNEQDYEKYLDECQQHDINFIAFHNYTGGGERYFNYVEPMVKIQYKNVLPEAGFDHSGMARWGYLPMKVGDFTFGTDKLFELPKGVEYFGADGAVLAKTDEERYGNAQSLMQKVLRMAHDRGMQMAMGFEFGVAPPEYASIKTRGDMYWLGNGSMVYNPFDPDATGILYATIDDILETYEGIDWVYLWLNEHCMFGVDPTVALKNNQMKAFFEGNEKHFDAEGINENLKFLGVWAQAYIQKAYDYIKRKAPDTRVVIGGWGAEYQMGLLLRGLHKALPQDIVFSMLNPGQGARPHPDYFKDIAADRQIWAIPWLEGDYSLWHRQPRVADMRAHVKKAAEDKLSGVVAIHWRTEEIKPNFETFAYFASHPDDPLHAEDMYRNFCLREYGTHAAEHLAPILATHDALKTINNIKSDVYFAYTPAWGRINTKQAEAFNELIEAINGCLSQEKAKDKVSNLEWLKANCEFTLLLDKVSKGMEAAWKIREEALIGVSPPADSALVDEAWQQLQRVPIERMFKTYASRVRSRGELGALSSINQRVWQEYQLLTGFLQALATSK